MHSVTARVHSFLPPLLLIALVLAGVGTSSVPPARAATSWTVNLDANSTGPTDVTLTSSNSNAKSFRVGAVINATSTNPINNVFAWQFTINYNASAFVPQGDPTGVSLYPDGAVNTVLFGGQTTSGTVNWAGLINAGKAFGSSSITTTGTSGQISVFFTTLSPNPSVIISAKTLLANVQFELVTKPSMPQVFAISDVIILDNSGIQILGVISGTGAMETVTNEPPLAFFTAAPAPSVGPFAFTFNATASSDSDDTIADPGGYFWDFGDGTQDLGLTGPVVTRDFGVSGRFNVTLRVQDSLGATGSARDSLGNLIFNNQPSHTFQTVGSQAQDIPPMASFTFSPANPGVGQLVSFDASSSSDPDGVILVWQWDFGDSSLTSQTSPFASHSYSTSGNFTVVLTVLDNGNLTDSAATVVPVHPLQAASQVVVDMDPSTPQFENTTFVTGGFKVNVDVLNVTDLYAWQFELRYDNTFLFAPEGNVTLGPVWQAAVANGQAFILVNVNQTAGVILVAFSFVGQVPHFTGTTVLATILFSPTQDGAGTLHLANTILVDFPPHTIPVTTRDGFVIATISMNQPPVAIFTFSPANPIVGEPVFFDGSASFDPDGFVQIWTWSFGDGTVAVVRFYPRVEHFYNSPGNYTVVLTVFDNHGLFSETSMVIVVHGRPTHDVAIQSVQAFPQVAVSSQSVFVQVVIVNKGVSNENVSLTAYYDNHVIATISGIFLPSCTFCTVFTYVQLVWDTTGVAPGNYTISAVVFLATDENPADNSMTDGQVEILPPPVLQATPSSGGLGTKVLVQGSGFPQVPPFFATSISFILVTFDDQLIGFANSLNGRFNFTFNIPHAEPGIHLIKAIDEITGARASTSFLVLATPTAPSSSLVVSVDVGAVYFPGDTADIYALVTLNGVLVGPASIQLHLIIIRPDGSNATLQVRSISPGLFKASLSIPQSGSAGTYAILATAHMEGPLDATAIRSFEVKPSWISQQGRNIATATAITGIIAVVAVAWRKGYLRKREEASSPSLSSS